MIILWLRRENAVVKSETGEEKIWIEIKRYKRERERERERESRILPQNSIGASIWKVEGKRKRETSTKTKEKEGLRVF